MPGTTRHTRLQADLPDLLLSRRRRPLLRLHVLCCSSCGRTLVRLRRVDRILRMHPAAMRSASQLQSVGSRGRQG